MIRRTAAAFLMLAATAHAGHLTEVGGERAVWYGGRTWTWSQLEARRDLNPARFDANHHTLGLLLADPCAAIERRDINPERFDTFHPFLGWLIAGLEKCVTPPPVCPPPVCPCPPPPDCEPCPPPIHVVPEPSTLRLLGIAGCVVLFCILIWPTRPKGDDLL